MGGQAQPIVVEIVGGGKVVDTEAMSPSVRQSYFDALARGDALYDTDEAGARAAWSEADRIAEPYIRPARPRPTAPVPHPPEVIPDNSAAIAVCTSPDVCRSPSAPVPYMVWGKGDDDDNYSPDVFSNGQRIKRADSRFTATYGDEPGTGLGVKSGTVGDVVEPVTSSAIVRANGIPIQRHTDTCTLNNGNCPGEYIHVQSTETTPAPDGRDEQDKAWYERAWDGTKEEAGKFWDGLYDNSSTVQDGHSILDRVGDYFGDPSLIGDDAKSAYESLPSPSEAWEWTKDAGSGIRDGAVDIWNDPGAAAEGAKDWVVDTATGIKDDVADAYDEGGLSAAAGAVIGKVGDVVSPSTKARGVKAGAEGLDAVADAQRRRNNDEPDEEDGGEGARSTPLVPRRDLECFNKPAHLSDEEFEKQLREQEAAINNSTADSLIARREAIREAGGTSPLRDLTAQSNARAAYEADRIEALINEGKSAREAARITADELSNLAATHRLDIIAGGDPSDISGMGDRRTNSSLGAQWRGRRADALEEYARQVAHAGNGDKKLSVRLRKC